MNKYFSLFKAELFYNIFAIRIIATYKIVVRLFYYRNILLILIHLLISIPIYRITYYKF